MKMKTNRLVIDSLTIEPFCYGMLEGLADFVTSNTLFYFLYHADKETKQFFDENDIDVNCISNDVITMFNNITQEIKPVWNSEKQFDRLAGFNFFNELYFEEYNKEDLTQAENELYDKYVREFSEMLIDIQTDIVDEEKEFGVIMKVA